MTGTKGLKEASKIEEEEEEAEERGRRRARKRSGGGWCKQQPETKTTMSTTRTMGSPLRALALRALRGIIEGFAGTTGRDLGCSSILRYGYALVRCCD